MTTMVWQNEWLAPPIRQLVGQVTYLPIMFPRPCSACCLIPSEIIRSINCLEGMVTKALAKYFC